MIAKVEIEEIENGFLVVYWDRPREVKTYCENIKVVLALIEKIF